MKSERLFALIERLRERGLAIIYVSHRMAEIARLADRVTVLRDGAYVGTITRAELTPERLVRMMVGRDLAGFYKKEAKAEPLERQPAVLRGAEHQRRPSRARLLVRVFAGARSSASPAWSAPAAPRSRA